MKRAMTATSDRLYLALGYATGSLRREGPVTDSMRQDDARMADEIFDLLDYVKSVVAVAERHPDELLPLLRKEKHPQ